MPDWCLYDMESPQFQELLRKFSNGTCTPEEEKFIIDWYENIWQPEQKNLQEPEKMIIQSRLWSVIKPHTVKRTKAVSFLKQAAIIAIPFLAAIGFYLHYQKTSVPPPSVVSGDERFTATPFDTRIYNDGIAERRIALSDGSEVVLQPASEVIVSKDFATRTREVHLKGEAFFKVRRHEGKPFLVFTNEVVTRVLGTSFNIRAYEGDGEITVAVRTGKVSVFSNKIKSPGKKETHESEEVILTPNQQVVYHRVRAQAIKQLVEEPEIIVPDSELFRMQFENAQVSEILEVLAKNYGVDIRYDEELLNDCRLTTSMSDEGFYERIEVICKAIGATYSVEDAVISIQSNGCE